MATTSPPSTFTRRTTISPTSADVTDREQVDTALDAIRTQLGPVSILVNAAGLDGFSRFTDISFDDWQRVVDVNLNGVFHCVRRCCPTWSTPAGAAS